MTPQEKRRDSHLRRRYGISLGEYQEILEYQDGVCAICNRAPKTGQNLCVDHDHTSRVIRGLLCVYCNLRWLGKRRDAERFRRTADYLEDPPAQHVVVSRKAPQNKQPRKRPRNGKGGKS